MRKIEYYRRTHPFAIVTHLKSSALLLLIPILQQLLFKPEGVFELIGTMGLNILYIGAVIFYAVASYRCYVYRLKPNGIQIKDGFFVKRYFTVPFSKIQTITFHKDIIARLFGAVKVSFDTPAGLSKFYDISAFFSVEKAKLILSKIESTDKRASFYKSNNISMLLMSAFWSNPASGLLFIAPLIYKTGNILGDEFQSFVYRTLNFQWKFLALGISPVASALANILLFGWVVSVIVQFFRYGGFSVWRQGAYIAISRGLINKNICFTLIDKIAALTINQSLIMHIFKLYSCGIFTIGAGKLKGDKSLIIAAEKKETLRRSIKNILRLSTQEHKSIYPAKNTLNSYLCVPLWIMAITVLTICIADYFSIFNTLFKVLLVFAIIPLLWWILFRVFAHKHSHIAMNNSCLIACGYKILTLKKYIIPFDKIQYISVKQSIFQKRKDTCDIQIYLYFEKRACHKVKHLPKADADLLTLYVQNKIK